MKTVKRKKVDPVVRLAALRVREEELRAAGYLRVAGVDEAGRGPLAGPVVAASACCVRAVTESEDEWIALINDSKQVSPSVREELHGMLTGDDSPFHIGVGIVDAAEIDRTNILRATHAAMRMAVLGLAPAPDYVIVDGTEIPELPLSQERIIRGDQRCLAIAAASIVAKVTRDRIMVAWAQQYPAYEFEAHKGYGTPRHIEALRQHGRCPIHRTTFTVAGLDPPRTRTSRRGR
jgi:ribonuclease HII